LQQPEIFIAKLALAFVLKICYMAKKGHKLSQRRAGLGKRANYVYVAIILLPGWDIS
jgi:hypothetical protein